MTMHAIDPYLAIVDDLSNTYDGVSCSSTTQGGPRWQLRSPSTSPATGSTSAPPTKSSPWAAGTPAPSTPANGTRTGT